MQTPLIYSSREIMEQIPEAQNLDFNMETLNNLNKDIEKKMQDFDIDKRKKTAESIQDLRNIVITA